MFMPLDILGAFAVLSGVVVAKRVEGKLKTDLERECLMYQYRSSWKKLRKERSK